MHDCMMSELYCCSLNTRFGLASACLEVWEAGGDAICSTYAGGRGTEVQARSVYRVLHNGSAAKVPSSTYAMVNDS